MKIFNPSESVPYYAIVSQLPGQCPGKKHYKEKVAEEDKQIEVFLKGNIFPIAQIVKPEVDIIYTSNINYKFNIYSPIVDYSIIITENNRTNNIIQWNFNLIMKLIKKMIMIIIININNNN